jgi:hypothetical protein
MSRTQSPTSSQTQEAPRETKILWDVKFKLTETIEFGRAPDPLEP